MVQGRQYLTTYIDEPGKTALPSLPEKFFNALDTAIRTLRFNGDYPGYIWCGEIFHHLFLEEYNRNHEWVHGCTCQLHEWPTYKGIPVLKGYAMKQLLGIAFDVKEYAGYVIGRKNTIEMLPNSFLADG